MACIGGEEFAIAGQSDRVNVVAVVIEDLRFGELGPGGDVKTPDFVIIRYNKNMLPVI